MQGCSGKIQKKGNMYQKSEAIDKKLGESFLAKR